MGLRWSDPFTPVRGNHLFTRSNTSLILTPGRLNLRSSDEKQETDEKMGTEALLSQIIEN
jgi:hypothetical protein